MNTNATVVPGVMPTISTQWVFIDKKTADRYLAANTHNRNKKLVMIKKLSADMLADRYAITHQGVAFDWNGVLLDGQNRLTAISETGIGQWVLVTEGLDPDSQAEMDAGAKRAASDFMDGGYTSIRATALRVLLAIDSLDGQKFNIAMLNQAMVMVTTPQIHLAPEDMQTWTGLFAPLASRASRNVSGIGPGALCAAAALYPDTGEEFLNGLILMSGLPTGDPRLALLKFRGGENRIQQPAAVFVAIKVAKAFATGHKLSVIRYSRQEEIRA